MVIGEVRSSAASLVGRCRALKRLTPRAGGDTAAASSTLDRNHHYRHHYLVDSVLGVLVGIAAWALVFSIASVRVESQAPCPSEPARAWVPMFVCR